MSSSLYREIRRTADHTITLNYSTPSILNIFTVTSSLPLSSISSLMSKFSSSDNTPALISFASLFVALTSLLLQNIWNKQPVVPCQSLHSCEQCLTRQPEHCSWNTGFPQQCHKKNSTDHGNKVTDEKMILLRCSEAREDAELHGKEAVKTGDWCDENWDRAGESLDSRHLGVVYPNWSSQPFSFS